MAKEIKFAVATVVFALGGEKNLARNYELYDVARELDRLAECAIETSREIAWRCTTYADGIEQAGCVRFDSTPMGYSSVEDLKRIATKADALWPIFKRDFKRVLGKEFSAVVKEMVEAKAAEVVS